MIKEKLLKSMMIRRLIREWFFEEGFVEVETPAMVRFPGQEPYLNPLQTVVCNERGNKEDVYLITSPELAHKKLLAAGFDKIFELARCFRNNEPRSLLHNPEFTMLEWYRSRVDYKKIMDDVEGLVSNIAFKLGKDIKKPWEQITVKDAFKKYADINLDNELQRPDFDDWFFKVFLTYIEPKLGLIGPVILYDYPASMAALAKIKEEDHRYAERFEAYIDGLELANVYSELTDVAEQKKRLLEEVVEREKIGKDVFEIDEDFMEALENGLPKSAGGALGVDRLVMALLSCQNIVDVIILTASKLFSS